MTGMAQIASYLHYTAILYNDINYMISVLFRIFVNMEISFKILIGRKN
jgi:hypothetical protein